MWIPAARAFGDDEIGDRADRGEIAGQCGAHRNRQCYSGAKLRPAINCTGGVRSGCSVIYRSLRALIDFRHHLRENLSRQICFTAH
jgi:hypothetical protein